jgi:hypothetical protein
MTMGGTRFVRSVLAFAALPFVTQAAAQTAGAADPLAARLEQVAGQYAPGGTLVGATRAGNLAESEEKRIALPLDGGKCYVFVAVGAEELLDLDLVLESAGERLGNDTRNDNFPTVRACTPSSARVEVVLTATRGAGAYLFGLYGVPPEGDEAEAIGAAAGAPPAVSGIAGQLEALAAERAPGATRDGDVFRGHLVEDEVAAITRQLRGETCYTFVALGGAGVTNLNMNVFVGTQKAGEDASPGVEAVVPDFCPSQGVTATVRVSMVDGNGDFAFGLYAREATGELVQIQTVDTAMLTRRLVERAVQAATGMNPAQAPQFGSLTEGRSANVSFATEAGKCYRVIGVAEPGIANLDLTLLVDGQTVGENVDQDALPVVGYCATQAGVGRVDVWSVTGSGGWAVGIYSGDQPTAAAAAGSSNPLVVMLDAAAQALAPGATRASEPFLGSLAVTASQQYDITLQAGKCYAFVGVSDVGNLDLEIASGTQVLGRDDDMDSKPGVLFCSDTARTIRAKLTLLSAPGNFAFGVYTAPAVQTATAQPQPTATGIAVGGAETDYIANQIRVLHEQRAAALLPVSQVNRGTLQQSLSSEFLVNLPAGRCYTIIAVGVPSVRDLDISLTSPYGQLLATDATDDATPVIVTNPCPQWSGDYRIKVLMQYGYGNFGFQVFSQ